MSENACARIEGPGTRRSVLWPLAQVPPLPWFAHGRAPSFFHPRRHPMPRTLGTLVALALIALPTFAQTRTTTRTGPAGQTATSTRTATRNPNGRTVTGTATGPAGQTASGSRTVARNSNGRTVSGTATGPEGKTASRSKAVSRTH